MAKSKKTKKPKEEKKVVSEKVEETVPENIREAAPKEKPKKEPVAKREDGLPLVPLKVFARLSGKKWDQMAGFEAHAKKQDLKPMTIPDWHAELQKFMDTPAR